MSDDASLNEGMESGKLAKDGLSIDGGLSMKVLVAGTSTGGFHDDGPKVIRVGSDRVTICLESDFDFEAQAVESDDVQWAQREIGSHENDVSPLRMRYEHEPHHPLGWSPDEIQGTV